MRNRTSLRRVLAISRIAIGNLCLLAILLSTGPILVTESVEASHAPIPSKEGPSKEGQSKESTAVSLVGIEHRLVRIRLHWTTPDFVRSGYGYLPPQPPTPISLVGHTLSHELLAPLRC